LNRTDRLKQSAEKQGKECDFLIFNQTNITYFSEFSGASALLIPAQGENTLYVSGVNYEQAKTEAKGATVELLKSGESLMEKIVKHASTNKLAVDTLPIESWRALAKAIGGEENLQLASGIIRELRAIKDQQEIQLIREACRLANIGMEVASEAIRPGVAEKTVLAEVECAMRKAGSDGVGFRTIVASGAYSAFPHGCSKEKTINGGDLVVVDLGATYKFYRSDITRTFTAGKPSEKQKKIYDTVKLAHQKAFETIKTAVQAKDVDLAARQVIEEAGFGAFFVHNLGHGVGLEVHEAPILSPESKDVLDVGNVVTDEPGIYVPSFGGVRIEDTLVVTKDTAEKLTIAPYTLERV